MDIGRNLVHGSDSPDNALLELALFFEDGELINYERNVEPWILE